MSYVMYTQIQFMVEYCCCRQKLMNILHSRDKVFKFFSLRNFSFHSQNEKEKKMIRHWVQYIANLQCAIKCMP